MRAARDGTGSQTAQSKPRQLCAKLSPSPEFIELALGSE